LVRGARPVRGDVRAFRERTADGALESSRAVPVDHAHLGAAGEEGIVEELVEAVEPLLDRQPDQVDLVRNVPLADGRPQTGGCAEGFPPRLRRGASRRRTVLEAYAEAGRADQDRDGLAFDRLD